MNPPPILTLTGNLLAERTFEFADWRPGKTQRARSASFQVGGKGVNVSKMLARLGTASTALHFAGGAPGDECRAWLDAHGIVHRGFSNRAPTRTGLVVRADGRGETTFLGPDAAPDHDACVACAAYLDAAPADAVLALCGSFPGWDTPAVAPVREAVQRRTARGLVVADTYGAPLATLAQQPLALIKLNRDEFNALFPTAEHGHSTPELLAAAIRRWPVRQWIVTDGPRAVCYGGATTAPATQTPPAVREVSATGSGDVLFACVLHAWLARGFALAPAVAFSLPYAAANAASPGVADFDLNNPILGRSLPHE